MPELPDELAKAFSDGGQPTERQVRTLMELEARELGMTFREAVDAAICGKLPHTPIAIDFRYWVSSLNLG